MTRSLRRTLATACFAALALLSLDPVRVVRPLMQRDALRRELTQSPDGPWWPDYPRFLAEVRARTHDGDSIALVFPRTSWYGGYSYAYFRASYLLASREVLPVIAESDRPLPQNVQRAQWLAVIDAQHRGRLVRR